VIPRFFDEKSGLKLVFASLIRASQRWRRLNFTFEEQMQILELRVKLGQKAKIKEIKVDSGIPHAEEIFSRKNET